MVVFILQPSQEGRTNASSVVEYVHLFANDESRGILELFDPNTIGRTSVNDRPGMHPGDSSDVVLYTSQDGTIRLEVPLAGETIWLTQNQIAKLFGTTQATVSRHIKNIYADDELDRESSESLVSVTQEEKYRSIRRELKAYSLDMVLSVGYRVNSRLATHFRRWATGVLKEYAIKGFAINDERLKDGHGDYWRELLERIRDIRSSEKMLYRQVLDLYATAIDYDPKAEETKRFFAIVQNKLHYGAHGHTAAEVVWERADASKPFMGLTSFDGSEIRIKDVVVAKNYLTEDELKSLNTLVSGYFDLAEFRAQNHQSTTMSDFIELLDNLMITAGAPLLQGSGNVSHKQAKKKAETEYRKYQVETVSSVEAEYYKSLSQAEEMAKRLVDSGSSLEDSDS